ncbi:UDP-2,3-diacylglucosamine hydrolase [Gemmatimonadetes bacterium T265]|nr:UDP-2,3-diacylglucosamine hydrolase [Gemmatimonadetes bacterium T265]
MSRPGAARDGTPAVIVSDVHIGAVPDTTERAFLEFLRYAARDAGALVIAGDLFDVGPVDAGPVVPPHAAVIARVAEAVRAGLSVSFIGGNRDPIEWSGPALRGVGVRVLPDPSELWIAGRRALVAHGDGARWGASPYRNPYPLLRHPALVWGVRQVMRTRWREHAFRALAERSPTRDRAARHARGEPTGPKRRAPAIEAWARMVLDVDPGLALVVAGHSHLPALVEVAPGRFYVNAGDWVSHFTYVIVPPGDGAPEVRVWPSREPVDWGTLPDADVPAAARDGVAPPNTPNRSRHRP